MKLAQIFLEIELQWQNDRLAHIPEFLYRNTKTGSFENTATNYVGGELGGGIYFITDKDTSFGYSYPTDRSIHQVTWTRRPSPKEVAYAMGDRGTAVLITGDSEEIWKESTVQDWKQNRIDMLAAAKQHNIKVIIGLSTHEGAGQISVLDPSLLKLVFTTNI